MGRCAWHWRGCCCNLIFASQSAACKKARGRAAAAAAAPSPPPPPRRSTSEPYAAGRDGGAASSSQWRRTWRCKAAVFICVCRCGGGDAAAFNKGRGGYCAAGSRWATQLLFVCKPPHWRWRGRGRGLAVSRPSARRRSAWGGRGCSGRAGDNNCNCSSLSGEGQPRWESKQRCK